jgi:hypothetical protein
MRPMMRTVETAASAACRRCGRLAVIALAALPCLGLAEPGSEELSGVRTVSFLVEDLGEGAIRCGLTKGALEFAARRVVGRTSLRIGPMKDSDGYIYVNVNVIYAPPIDYCAFSVGLRFNTFGDARTRYGTGYFAMTLFDTTAVGIFRRYRTALEVGNVIDQLTGRFVEEWSRANPPRATPGSATGASVL